MILERRRRQTVRAAAAVGATLVVIAVVATVSLSGDDRTVTPAVTTSTSAAPASSTSAPGTTTSLTGTTAPVVLPSLPPIGWDTDGVPDALYAQHESDTGFDVVDPNTFEVTGTVDQLVYPPVAARTLSASGNVRYGDPRDQLRVVDECRQALTSGYITGADLTGLPERLQAITLSADGTTVAFMSVACPDKVVVDDLGLSTDPYAVVVLVADADDPGRTAREVYRSDASVESLFEMTLSPDGSYLQIGGSTTPGIDAPMVEVPVTGVSHTFGPPPA